MKVLQPFFRKNRFAAKDKKNRWAAVGGAAAGLINGLLGSAGGLLAVPTLRRSGLDTKESHATSVAIILPVSIASAALYLSNGAFSPADALPYLPGGLAGAFCGGLLLPHIPSHILRRVFGLFMLWAAVRLICS